VPLALVEAVPEIILDRGDIFRELVKQGVAVPPCLVGVVRQDDAPLALVERPGELEDADLLAIRERVEGRSFTMLGRRDATYDTRAASSRSKMVWELLPLSKVRVTSLGRRSSSATWLMIAGASAWNTVASCKLPE
jgi:hypothetical protein